MPCSIVGPKGNCKMPALKGQPFCFVHAPSTQAARKAAAARGGSKRRRFRAPELLPSAMAAFDLGPLDHASDVGPALLKLTSAMTRGQVPADVGRRATEAMRIASRAFESAPPIAGTAKGGWSSLTDEEIAFIRAHDGKLPPGRTLEELDQVS